MKRIHNHKKSKRSFRMPYGHIALSGVVAMLVSPLSVNTPVTFIVGLLVTLVAVALAFCRVLGQSSTDISTHWRCGGLF